MNCIPKTDEKYISFSKSVVMKTFTDSKEKEREETLEIRFLDSLKFTLKSLDSLVKGLGQFKHLERGFGTNGLLMKKGVFPYEFMTGFDKLAVNKLPPIKEFYSKLNGSHISCEEYRRAQKVWKELGCKTMRDYHDLYLKMDVLLLADVMENYRDVCYKNYGLDPLWYYTAPGLAWDAALKISKVKLKLLTDPFIPMTTIPKKSLSTSNTSMRCWAMSQPLPIDGFEWMSEEELKYWDEGKGCILKVDIEYPKELHDSHNENPLAPERLRVNKVHKLIPNLINKEKYVIHHENLTQYISLGLKLTKIHSGIKFNERPWLKDYIQLNTDLRTKGTTDFEKDFFKLMNNSVFGKTMENIRNRIDVRLVTKEEELEKLVKKPNFDRVNIFTINLVAVHMHKTTINLMKPIY